MNPTDSFLRFLLGFLTFIGVSFAVTYAVSTYTIAQDEQEQTASAIQAMIDKE